MRRAFDMMCATIGLVVLSPLLVAIALAIKLLDGGALLYRQRRVGQGFRPFFVYKFRTMVPGADGMGPAITPSQDSRVTRLGRFLRRYKLDELPQLVNILRGEMALVGPRPEVPRYVERFRTEYARLLRFRPGITDPATLAFANEEEMLSSSNPEETYAAQVLPKKLTLSLDYSERRTWRSDLAVVLRTLGRVISPRRAAAPCVAAQTKAALTSAAPSTRAEKAPFVR